MGPHRYFLTFCTHHRRCYFVATAIVELTRTQILRAAVEQTFAVIAYCFTPDHLHLLVQGDAEGADLKQFIRMSKQYSAFYVARSLESQRLWQRFSFERVLRSNEETWSVAKYIVNNPVRAGLVSHPAEYPFWGSAWYSREELLEYIQRAA